MKQILVIRLGALGDMFLSFAAFAAIRAAQPEAHITLLTTAPFADLAGASPWFDAVRLDRRPAWFNPSGLLRLRRQLTGFDFVYDLQTSRRSSRYFRLAGRPPWSGIARGCSHPDADPNRNALHTVARQRGQLAAAGVAPVDHVDIAWLKDRGPIVSPPYVVLVPGTSGSHGGAKTWPAPRYAEIAAFISAHEITPVIAGTAAEKPLARLICAACPKALDLTGQTSIIEIAGLTSRASLTIGGDTGPVHLAGVMGCRTVALLSQYTDPVAACPVGDTTLLRAGRVDAIGVDDVLEAVKKVLLF